jgi:hypothetical protein
MATTQSTFTSHTTYCRTIGISPSFTCVAGQAIAGGQAIPDFTIARPSSSTTETTIVQLGEIWINRVSAVLSRFALLFFLVLAVSYILGIFFGFVFSVSFLFFLFFPVMIF